jgi:hypothetical protein
MKKNNLPDLVLKNINLSEDCDKIKNDIVSFGFSIVRVDGKMNVERLDPKVYLRGEPCSQKRKSKK